MKIILASASPRRKEILQQLGCKFKVIPADIEEIIEDHWTPEYAVCQLAEQKALAISHKYSEQWVIGSDTVVVHNQKILGKPSNQNEALEWLSEMQNSSHFVYTGVSLCLNGKAILSDFQTTKVYFRKLSQNELLDYLKLGEYKDKAGAYGIQGFGCRLVDSVEGCFFNVMGLPINLTLKIINEYIDNE